MNITILNVVKTSKNDKNGKPFHTLEVAYKNNTFQGKVEGFKVTQFQKAFNDVAVLQPGETVEVNIEKKNGFNEWVSVSKEGGPQVVASSTERVQKQPSSGDMYRSKQSSVSTYETAEERAKKQVYIVRQSSIASAVSALSVGAKSSIKVSDVLSYARELEAYVFNLGGATGFDDIPDLDPIFLQEPQVE